MGRKAAQEQGPPSDNCHTPAWVYAFALRHYGPFTLDAAADTDNRLVARWCGPRISGRPANSDHMGADGLACSWANERVWCNPPYSDPLPWVQKATEARTCVMLLKADFGTAWGRLAAETADDIGLFLRRLKHGGYGRGKGAPWSSMLVAWGAPSWRVRKGPELYFIDEPGVA